MKLPYIYPNVELINLSAENVVCIISGAGSGEDMGITDPQNPFGAPMFELSNLF